MIKVIIVDDHALFRAGLRLILAQQDQIEVVGEAGSGEEALRVAKRLEPDICLMDLQMPGGMGGIEATRRLLRLVPNCRIIALKTVSTYRQRIYEKLGVHTDVDLTRLAMRHGLIREDPGSL